MTPPGAPTGTPPRGDADGWVDCACGSRHWGLAGAAGLLVWRDGADGSPEVLLQHRALWSHHGGTWGLPGGALHRDETPVVGGARESAEEVGVGLEDVRVFASRALRHPDWGYTTVVAAARDGVEASVQDAESLAVRWVPAAEVEAAVAAGRVGPEGPTWSPTPQDPMRLLPALAGTWPELGGMLCRPVLVVDAANVVGARPDGWWKDRRAAAERLLTALARLTAPPVGADAVPYAPLRVPAALLGLAGELWAPRVVVVTEGRARGARPPDGAATGAAAVGDLTVVEAPGEGDDEIVAQARTAAVRPGSAVTVVTADRELRARLAAPDVDARTVGPGALWELLDAWG